MKILIVDDEPLIRAMVRAQIEKHLRADITEASSGSEALDVLKKTRCDIVISDQWMEKGLGTDILKFLEEDPRRATFFVLFSSDPEIVDSLRRANRCSAVMKPDLNHLLNCVTEACCINFFS
jgi:DNA-binding NarL/FixJ family response regulator